MQFSTAAVSFFLPTIQKIPLPPHPNGFVYLMGVEWYLTVVLIYLPKD